MDKEVILIIGASSGIGAAIAKRLSDENTDLILVGRRQERLQDIQKSLRGETTISLLDVTNRTEINAFFDDLKEKGIKLSGLIYCTGIYGVKPIKVMESGELEEFFKINLFGFYEICRLFQSPKVSKSGSAIIGLSSISSVKPEPGLSAYSMTKAAMNAMVKSLSAEFLKREIRINAILPAITMSKMGMGEYEQSEEECIAIKEYQKLGAIPLSEIAEMAAFLMSDNSKHMTGELITISAGYHEKG